MDRYEIVGTIAQGSFGIVYEAIERSSNRRVAIKKNLIEAFVEIDVLFRLRSPYVLQGLDLFEHDGYIHLVLPFALDNVYGWIEDDPSFVDRFLVCGQIVRAVYDLHRAGMCHYDIKPENVLYMGQDNDQPQVLLADFSTIEYRTPDLIRSSKFSPPWRPPEGNPPMRYDERSDVFSLGWTIFEILSSKERPGRTEGDRYFTKPRRTEVNLINKTFDDPLRSLIISMTEWNVEDRATMDEVLQYFNSCLSFKPIGKALSKRCKIKSRDLVGDALELYWEEGLSMKEIALASNLLTRLTKPNQTSVEACRYIAGRIFKTFNSKDRKTIAEANRIIVELKGSIYENNFYTDAKSEEDAERYFDSIMDEDLNLLCQKFSRNPR